MPVSRNDHHTQLFATPFSRTRFVTRFGVSVLNVVATIETPISHHGAERPEVKNSEVLDPPRFAMRAAGTNATTMEIATIHQSKEVRCMWRRGDGRWWTVDGRRSDYTFQLPRVKSGNFTGALPFATLISLSGKGALHAAESYTSMSGTSPSRRHSTMRQAMM